LSTPPNFPVQNEHRAADSLSHRIFLNDSGRVRAIFRTLLFLFYTFVLYVTLGVALGGALAHASPWWQLFWASVALDALFLLLSWFFLRVADGRSFSSLGISFHRGWGSELAVGLAIGASLQVFVTLVLIVSGSVHYSNSVTHDAHFWKRVGMNVVLFSLAALVEELLFRGYAFQCFIESVGASAAVIVSSLLFGLAHLANPSPTVFSTLNTMLAGAMLALPYLRTRSLWTQAGLHMSWNFMLCTVTSLPVSGISFGPSYFIAQDAAHNWISGGSYGPEGGAAVTLACLVAIVWLLRTRVLAPSPALREVLQ
jgi:uncharacterized protein